MTSTLDPYHKWLGISPKDQPPNHYRLLAIDLFESDPEVIDAAANRQMAYVQRRAIGEHAALSQRLLNELSMARLSLLDAKKKAAYDESLRSTTDVPAPANPKPLEQILQQAQQAYNQGRFQDAVKLLKSHSGIDQDSRHWNLLKRSASAITKIDSLTKSLTEARTQNDPVRAKELAGQILTLQPSHPKAKPLLRWAENRLGERQTPSEQSKPDGKINLDPILRKYLPIVAAVIAVTLVLTLLLDVFLSPSSKEHPANNRPKIRPTVMVPANKQPDKMTNGARQESSTPVNQPQAPKIVSMKPPNGATNVDPDLKEIRVTFDQPMASSHCWSCLDSSYYPKQPEGRVPYWINGGKTCVLPVRLEPLSHYRLSLNTPDDKGFVSLKDQPLAPVVYTFHTGKVKVSGMTFPR